MFTGIIEELGVVQKIGGGKLTIKAHEVLTDVHIGDSIAVNGVCLTVTQFTAASFTADVMPETIRRTSYANLSSSARSLWGTALAGTLSAGTSMGVVSLRK